MINMKKNESKSPYSFLKESIENNNLNKVNIDYENINISNKRE